MKQAKEAPDRYEELRDALARVPTYPWLARPDGTIRSASGKLVLNHARGIQWGRENAAFAMHARNYLPRLLAEHDAMTSALNHAYDTIKHLSQALETCGPNPEYWEAYRDAQRILGKVSS